ncbi:MAG: peptide deformylase [Ruminococcus sp.]|nr:peptide deformylase [Ruminococcus sp.]
MPLTRKTIEKDETFLRQISSEVDFKKDNFLEYIEALKDYCENNSVYALAPVQIGIPKRIIYIKNTSSNMDNNVTNGYNEEIIYINPIIISAKGKTIFLEGCASCIYHKEDKRIYYAGIVERPYMIEIEYFDLNGNKNRKTIEGFEATVFSHEYDHLNGILHMDKSKEIFEMTLAEMKEYRANNPYTVISKDGNTN